MAGLDHAVLHRVEHFQRRHDHARAEGLDLHAPAGQGLGVGGETFQEILVEGRAFRNRGRHSPGDVRRGGGTGGACRNDGGGQGAGQCFHGFPLWMWKSER